MAEVFLEISLNVWTRVEYIDPGKISTFLGQFYNVRLERTDTMRSEMQYRFAGITTYGIWRSFPIKLYPPFPTHTTIIDVWG